MKKFLKKGKKIGFAAVLCLLAAACGALLLAGCESAKEESKDPAGEPSDTPSGQAGTDPTFDPAALQFLSGSAPVGAPKDGTIGEDFRKGYAKLAMQLLTKCREKTNGQLMVSPLSVLTALAMTANGADGETLAEMEQMLTGLPLEQLNEQLALFVNSLPSEENAKFSSANALFVNPLYQVKDHFLNTVQGLYRAEIAKTDFGNPALAAKNINDWCKEKTDGMIDKVVKENDFDLQTLMVLVNALCFDAKWESPYLEESQIADGVFHAADGEKTLTFLRETAYYEDYLSSRAATGFVKLYEGGKYGFMALLPKKDLDTLLSELTPEAWLELWNTKQKTQISTAIPKFKTGTDVELKEVLAAMGMQKAFSGEAEFTNMIEGVPVNVGKVIHKTFLELDNEGTRAAAVTAVEMRCTASPVQPKQVILDRPFLYAIVDMNTGLPIFFGTFEGVTE